MIYKIQVQRLGAYILIVLLGVLGFWRLTVQQHNIEDSRIEASTKICERVEQVAIVLRNIIEVTTQTKPEDTPEIIIRKNEFKKFTTKELSSIPCKSVVKKTI